MKIIKNEKLIQRNSKIGQFTSLASLAVLGIGMYISFQKPEYFYYSFGSLILGFILMQVGMFFTNRWGRTPRPDEQLDASLKGLPGETVIYHYVTPVSHLLLGPAGIWILMPFHQRGKVSYEKNRWKLSGGGFMQTYMTIFGQEGIGRPDLELENQVDSLRKYFSKKLEGDEAPEIKGILVFTNEQVEVDDTGSPIPALQIKKLKEFMRQRSKEQSLGALMLQKLTSALPQE